MREPVHRYYFFFNDTATTEIYTLSLHDALPIFLAQPPLEADAIAVADDEHSNHQLDRKSTRLNSSHSQISYAVFCLKKKKNNMETYSTLKSRFCQNVQKRANESVYYT